MRNDPIRCPASAAGRPWARLCFLGASTPRRTLQFPRISAIFRIRGIWGFYFCRQTTSKDDMPRVNFQIPIAGAPRTVRALRLKAAPLIITILAASLLLGAAQVSGLDKPTDRAAALVARDPVGREWIMVRETAGRDDLAPGEPLRLLAPWAKRYHAALPPTLHSPRRRHPAASSLDASGERRAVSSLIGAIDDAVRRSVAAKSWEPMGELAPWEAFLTEHGFHLTGDRPSRYIVGVRHRTYSRPPRLPQAIHSLLLTTRAERRSTIFALAVRYTYPTEVAQRIEALERTAGDYEGALALRLPAFQADRPLLVALGRQALAEKWPAHQEGWREFVHYISAPALIASRARILAAKNPPTLSEVRRFAGLIAHLYDIGPDGRLEITPEANALDLRGNPLYGVRTEAR